MAPKIDPKFERKLTRAITNDIRNLSNFYRLKNSDFIWQSKIAEINQTRNSKQPDRPDTV